MSPAERQTAIDSAAKLGHVIRPDGRNYRCSCGHFITGRDKDLAQMGIDLHARNAVNLGRKIDVEPPMVAHSRDGE